MHRKVPPPPIHAILHEEDYELLIRIRIRNIHCIIPAVHTRGSHYQFTFYQFAISQFAVKSGLIVHEIVMCMTRRCYFTEIRVPPYTALVPNICNNTPRTSHFTPALLINAIICHIVLGKV